VKEWWGILFSPWMMGNVQTLAKFIKICHHQKTFINSFIWVSIFSAYKAILVFFIYNILHTPCSRVLLGKLIGLLSRNSPHFMEPKGSILFSQGSATCPYPQPDESSPHFVNINIHIIIASKPKFSQWSLLFRFPNHHKVACSCAPCVCDMFQLS
jgi:hypothetical protein